jgi:hypothetical protein
MCAPSLSLSALTPLLVLLVDVKSAVRNRDAEGERGRGRKGINETEEMRREVLQ